MCVECLHFDYNGRVWRHMGAYGGVTDASECMWIHMDAYGCTGMHMDAKTINYNRKLVF